MRRMIVRAGLVAAALVVAAGTTPANAASIERESFSFGGAGVVDFLPCSFPVHEVFEVQGVEVARFDRDGDFLGAQIHSSAVATFTNMDTGVSVEDTDHWSVLVDGDGSAAIVGLSFHVNVPGRGIEVLHAGRMVVGAEGAITFLAGPHDQITTDGQALCAALS